MSTDWRTRAVNLVQAARDLRIGESSHPSCELAGSSHEGLFARYVADLAHAKKWAEGWWNDVLTTERSRTPDEDEALRICNERFPSGLAAHAAPVYVIRKYWLACAEQNTALAEADRIHPEDFLLSFLIGRHDELAAFLSTLPFWPIGMDQDGNWV